MNMLAFVMLLCLYHDNHGLRCVVTWDGPHVTLRHEAMHGDGWNEGGTLHVVWMMDGAAVAHGTYRIEGGQIFGQVNDFARPGHPWQHWMVRRQR